MPSPEKITAINVYSITYLAHVLENLTPTARQPCHLLKSRNYTVIILLQTLYFNDLFQWVSPLVISYHFVAHIQERNHKTYKSLLTFNVFPLHLNTFFLPSVESRFFLRLTSEAGDRTELYKQKPFYDDSEPL